MEKETSKPLQDLSFTELIGLKSSPINREDRLLMTQRVDRELRLRVNLFRDYIDRYDQLTVEQKEITAPCFAYRMALGSMACRHISSPESVLEQDGHRAEIASKIATVSLNEVARQSVESIIKHKEEPLTLSRGAMRTVSEYQAYVDRFPMDEPRD